MTIKTFISLIFIIFSLSISPNYGENNNNEDKIYIVYMGDANSLTNKINHNNLITSLLKRKKNAVIKSYKHGFAGFAARLSESDAKEVAKHPGVVSVFPEPTFQLHTTRSWDFLQDETSLLITSRPVSSGVSQTSSDTIIGILDTGIWPESESFNDKGMGEIPARWKGTCVEGLDFNSFNCNKKLIGARYYTDSDTDPTVKTPRDSQGHGTHVSSTAAGSPVPNSSYYNLAPGTSKGGSSSSRISMYRVCNNFGCSGSAILAAFDDAIADGVDVLSLSLGASGFKPEMSSDPIAIGSFHAVQRGITVVCSAGNDGPSEETVVNVAPWIITVAASTIDRDFQSVVVLGNMNVIWGGSINFSGLEKSPIYPLISGESAKNSSGSEIDARNCYPDALDAQKINGTIVVCEHDSSTSDYTMKVKRNGIKALGGIGVIFIEDKTRLVASNTGSYPATVITAKDGAQILDYIKSTGNPMATILPTETVTNFKPAPTVAYFSSRGPSSTTKNLLKPDIAAPGVNILAAWFGNDTSPDTTPLGKPPPRFNLLSGTSMACPHVSGIVASVKSQNPTWSPSAIRSAIMTTAIQMNNEKRTITTETGKPATPYDYGAGEVSPTAGLQPGLVYELDPTDYLQFLCYYGYTLSTIKLISPQIPDSFSCPNNSTKDIISNINYPSIAISKNGTTSPTTVTRTVTNVNNDVSETIYTVLVDAPKGLDVIVTPNELKFTAEVKKLSYQVMFMGSGVGKGDLFGAITWSNNKYSVRSPFVVRID